MDFPKSATTRIPEENYEGFGCLLGFLAQEHTLLLVLRSIKSWVNEALFAWWCVFYFLWLFYFLWDSCFPSFSSFFHSLSDLQRRSNLGCHTPTLSTAFPRLPPLVLQLPISSLSQLLRWLWLWSMGPQTPIEVKPSFLEGNIIIFHQLQDPTTLFSCIIFTLFPRLHVNEHLCVPFLLVLLYMWVVGGFIRSLMDLYRLWRVCGGITI